MRLEKLQEGIKEYQEFYFSTVRFELLVIHMEMPCRCWKHESGGWGKVRAEGSWELLTYRGHLKQWYWMKSLKGLCKWKKEGRRGIFRALPA